MYQVFEGSPQGESPADCPFSIKENFNVDTFSTFEEASVYFIVWLKLWFGEDFNLTSNVEINDPYYYTNHGDYLIIREIKAGIEPSAVI